MEDKPLIWFYGELKTPPLTSAARIEAGYYLRLLQLGDKLGMPHSRPMPSIGSNCHELRINDENATWRIVYKIYFDAILILEVFNKQSQRTPKKIIDVCKKRIKEYENE